MDDICIPADVFFELPFYAAQVAANSDSSDAKQMWAVIGALAQTCREVAKSVRNRKSTLLRASMRNVRHISLDGAAEITTCYYTLPNGLRHGILRETRLFGAAPVGSQLHDKKYVTATILYEFGRIVRYVSVHTLSDYPATVCICDPEYLRTGESLHINLKLSGLITIDEEWLSACPDSLENFFHEFTKRLEFPIVDTTVYVMGRGIRNTSNKDQPYLNRYNEACKFVDTMVKAAKK